MGLDGMFRKIGEKINKLTTPNPEELKKAKEDMDAFLKRDFDALSPDAQQKALDEESTKLRGEIDGLRKHANDLEEKSGQITRARAEDPGTSVEAEMVKLQTEIDSIRQHADDVESRFDDIVRGRAEGAENRRLRGLSS